MKNDDKNEALDSLVGGDCVGLTLRQAVRRVSRRYDEALANHGLTIGQLGIMAAIKGRSVTSVQELADFFDMDQSAMSRSLKPLGRNGLIMDHSSARDRRRRQVSLTDEGETLLRDAARTWNVVQSQMLEDLIGDMDQLRSMLDSLARD